MPASRLTGSDSASINRYDPFYDGVWERGQAAQVRTRRRMEARRAAGLGNRVHWFEPTTEEIVRAETRLVSSRWEEKLAVLGALDSWRSLTISQCAALTGMPQLLRNRAGIIRELYALDLLDVGHGESFSDWQVQQKDVAEWLIRPTKSARFEELIEPHLTYSESLRITGGRDWITGGQYDRHNILATEFALRIAEFSEAAAVLGERWSGASELMYEGWGRHDPYPEYAGRGDFTIVRSDGLRIVVEMTASASGYSFQKKVDRWAQRLAADPLAAQGVVVLFVTIGDLHPVTGRRGDPKNLHAKVRTQLSQAVRKFPGTYDNRTGERMFFIEWAELFPARHEQADDFAQLPAYSPVGAYKAGAEEMWERKYLLNTGDMFYWPETGLAPAAVIENARTFLGTPWWLRTAPAPQVAVPLAKGLFPAGLPGVVAGDSRGRGVAGAFTLPPRTVV
ncbi:hypothetical protein ACXR2T_08100 [Leucobacter sp. HY1910]